MNNMFLYLVDNSVDISSILPDNMKINGQAPSLQQVFDHVSTGFVAIMGTFAVLSMLYGSYLYVVSAGNEELQTRAKAFLRYPILGLVIAAFAYLIVKLIVKIMLGS